MGFPSETRQILVSKWFIFYSPKDRDSIMPSLDPSNTYIDEKSNQHVLKTTLLSASTPFALFWNNCWEHELEMYLVVNNKIFINKEGKRGFFWN